MELFDSINFAISFLVSILIPLGSIIYWLFSSMQKLQKEGFSKGVYLSAVSLFVIAFPIFGLVIFPTWLGSYTVLYPETSFMTPSTIRWVLMYMLLCPFIFFITKDGGKIRALVSSFAHLTILLFGWALGKWIGMFFISAPILAVFYIILYYLVQVVLPSSNPEAPLERKNKFLAIIWYVWGNQYPFWFAKSAAARDVDKCIDGDFFKGYGKPGVVWTHSHQVVGISSGIEFTQVAGPGILFTEQYDRPVAVVDLRTQLRTKELKTVTKDGISITAFLFVSFKIDDDNWLPWEDLDKDKRHKLLRAAPILWDGLELDRKIGSFPYSTARVHAALSAFSVEHQKIDNEAKRSLAYWDEIVVQRALDEARLVLSNRNLNQLWVPEKDDLGASALVEIGAEIKKRLTPRLQEFGVKLFSARIINFSLDESHPIHQRQVASWKARWKQRSASTITDGKARSNVIMEEANTYAKAAFLEAFTQSLSKARDIHVDLPKHVVALHFISALENLLIKSPEDSREQQQKLNTLKEIIIAKK